MTLSNSISQYSLESDELAIWFLGQSGYLIKSRDAVIAVDPYLSDFVENKNGLNDRFAKRRYPPPLDPSSLSFVEAVLITHGHNDHMDPWTLGALPGPFDLFLTEVAWNQNKVSGKMRTVIRVEPFDNYETCGFSVTPIPAAHYDVYDPKTQKVCSVSYVVKYGDHTLFFWGDGIMYEGLIDHLGKYRFDYFFAPINGRDWFREKLGIVGSIGSRELVELTKYLNIDTVSPNHFDLFSVNGENPNHFLHYLATENPNQRAIVLQAGENIVLKKCP
ncbi:MBL fold metallo-hydrolase [bacterium]|nr:MAG: MBL fold metallo-hydrolase [bacterium]